MMPGDTAPIRFNSFRRIAQVSDGGVFTPLTIIDGAIQSLKCDKLAGPENALYRLEMLRPEIEALFAANAQLVSTVEQLGNMLAAGSGNQADTAKLQALRAAMAPGLSFGLLPNWNGHPRISVAFNTSGEAWAFHDALTGAVSNG